MRRTTPLVATAAAVSLLALGFGLTACGDDDDSSGSGATDAATSASGEAKKIHASINSREVPFYQDIVKGIEQQAAAKGWEVTVSFAENDPTRQIDQTENALIQQPDGLILGPIDREALVPVASEATADDVPVVTLGDDLSDQTVRASYVGGDFPEFGRVKARWIAEELGGKGRVGFVHGIRGLDFTEAQFEGAKEVFADSPDIEIVDGPYAGGFSSDLGLDAATNLLTANPDLDAIYFDNDDLALGGASAAQERNADVLIIGTDGTAAGLEGVRTGEIDFSISQCAIGQGRAAVNTLEKVFNGEEVESVQFSPIIELTPDTFEAQQAELAEKCE